jgi:urease accessory protein
MIAKLDIQTARRGEVTYLKNSFFTTPLKLANITEDKNGAVLHLMIMSSSPGILDGDEYDITIDVAENTNLHLHTQSYQRLFNMKQGATQKMNVHLACNSSFCFIPHPAVPQEQSIFTAINKIYLTDKCHVIFGEILTCGRKLNGEVFLFSKYHNKTEIYLHNKLVVKENLLIQPALIDLNAIGQLEGYTHQASLIIIKEDYDVVAINDFVNSFLLQQEDIDFGISALHINGLMIRIIGHKAEQLFNCLKHIATYLQQITLPQSVANVV